VLIHLFAFILFFAGSALEGEIWWSKALGFAMGVVVLLSFLIWCIRRLKKRNPALTTAT
jgi:hypothetical protein